MANKMTQALAARPTVPPEMESKIISTVGQQYGLTDEQMRLLFAIRKAENGSQGKEFGVLTPQAMRFKDDPDPTKSFTTQAMWAAGTIKKHFDGDIQKFADRWAPIGASNDPKGLNKNWVKNVSSFMEAQ